MAATDHRGRATRLAKMEAKLASTTNPRYTAQYLRHVEQLNCVALASLFDALIAMDGPQENEEQLLERMGAVTEQQLALATVLHKQAQGYQLAAEERVVWEQAIHDPPKEEDMEVEYRLLVQDLRENSEQCASCKNRLPDGDCAVELAVVSGGVIFDTVLDYQDTCEQRE
jgi:hypothetical protein